MQAHRGLQEGSGGAFQTCALQLFQLIVFFLSWHLPRGFPRRFPARSRNQHCPAQQQEVMDAPTAAVLPSQDNGMQGMACADPKDPRSPPTSTPEAGLGPKSSSPSRHSKIPRPDPSCKRWSRQGSDSRVFPKLQHCPLAHTVPRLSHRASLPGQAQKTAQAAGLLPGPSQSFLSSALTLALRPRDPDPISQATSQPGRV